MHRFLTSAFLAPLFALVCAAHASAQLVHLSAPSIDGAQQVPPTPSLGSGSGCLTLDLTTHRLHFEISIGGLGSAEIAASIRDAPPGSAGPALLALPLGATKWGLVPTSPALEAALLAGNGYVDIRTVGFPTGEIRGQILVTPCLPVPAGMEFCSNGTLGVDHITPCPCGGVGAQASGCPNSVNPFGAHLGASGAPATNDVVLHASGMPGTAFGLYMQHSAPGDVVFHDGVLCAGGALIRLRGVPSVGGASSFPDPLSVSSTITLSSRGGVIPGSGVRRYYGVWYRNPALTFCAPGTANVTNGYIVDW